MNIHSPTNGEVHAGAVTGHPLLGPYDTLYASRPEHILWGERPSRLVDQFLNETPPGKHALDLGCGDGVNALALEVAGLSVLGVDISYLALAGLRNRFARSGRKPLGTYLNADVRTLPNYGQDNKFDCIVSCGLFQCLDPNTRVEWHRALFERLLSPTGTILFSCLTNGIPLQPDHHTNNLYLVETNEIDRVFEGWMLLHAASGTIHDSHRPIVGEHQHSVFWGIAKRPL
jgi:ubiquinone/menaquinone biosynthesis C-methylase UbiE